MEVAVDERAELPARRSRHRPGQLSDRGEKVTTLDVRPELAGPPRPIHHPVDRGLEPYPGVDYPGIGRFDDATEHCGQRADPLVGRLDREPAQRLERVGFLAQNMIGVSDDAVDG
jgi:hypothetical protein